MSSVDYKTLETRIDSIDVLHTTDHLGTYRGEGYHLALLRIASGDPFLKAVKKAHAQIVLQFMNKAVRHQVWELKRLRRSRRTAEVSA